MIRELKILILEDVPADAELMEEELTESGIAFVSKCVTTKTSFIGALQECSPEIILSDYSLPSFDGLSALKIAREKCPDIPFIFVSGALGEERAIELLKKGATDYVLKDRLSRLGPAVSRALAEVEERNERQRVENALKESEVRYRTIFENTGTATIIVDEDTTIVLANRQFERLSGFSRSEVEGKISWTEFVLENDREKVNDINQPPGNNFKMPSNGYEFRIINRQGDTLDMLANIAAIPLTKRSVMSLLDISTLKKAEKKILASNEMLRSLTSELVMTEERERRRIAVDLHDNIGQTLALTKIKLGSILAEVSISGLTEPLEEIMGMIDQSIQQTRSLMRELSPSVLYELGFTAAIEWLSEQIQGQHGLQISLINDIKTLKIDKEVQILLFRAIRELLLNVVKHARAKEAYISLQKSGGNIVVKVSDNGVGFDTSQTSQISKQTGGFGLISIQERIKHIGGYFEIKTGKGHGACITLVAPLKRRKILGGGDMK
jgi:two-component system, NarL family, sensor histidine kinase UhpB